MKVMHVDSLYGTDREVCCPQNGFVSLRAVLAKDGMGFSMHQTFIPAGPPQHWHYKNHLEACFCVSGAGILTNLATDEQHPIGAGSIYVLDHHDDHTFQAWRDTILVCVFNPPLEGGEVHGADGSYAPAGKQTR